MGGEREREEFDSNGIIPSNFKLFLIFICWFRRSNNICTFLGNLIFLMISMSHMYIAIKIEVDKWIDY